MQWGDKVGRGGDDEVQARQRRVIDENNEIREHAREHGALQQGARRCRRSMRESGGVHDFNAKRPEAIYDDEATMNADE